MMRRLQSNVLLFLVPFALAKQVAVELPRGVAPNLADLYRPTSNNHFACHSDPSIKLPFDSVNDDYCDCPDGSDEPGTAACSHLSSDVRRLPGFYCENKHHIPTYVSFLRVNDGICDYEECCDGSDEWSGVGGVKCPNKCKEIGAAARKIAAEKQKASQKGLKKNAELVAKASQLRNKVEEEIVKLQGEVIAREADLVIKKADLEKIENEERSRLVKGGRGKAKVLAGLAKDRIEELKGIADRLSLQRIVTEEKLRKVEDILRNFKETYNPNFNDEGVKAAAQAWDNYVATEQASKDTPAEEIQTDTIHADTIDWADWENDAPPSEDELASEIYQIERYLPSALTTIIRAKLRELRTFLIENGVLAESSASGDYSPPESKVLTAARNAKQTIEDALNDARNKLEDYKTDLNAAYGPSDVFRALKKECKEVVAGEYTYKHCFLENCYQQPSGQSSTHLGSFKGIDENVIDDDGETWTVLRYEDGTRCWNGPARSAMVYLRCESEDVIHTVFEAEKCSYKFTAGSPAVCGWKADDKNGGSKKRGRPKKEEL